jgi:hypothetical protein
VRLLLGMAGVDGPRRGLAGRAHPSKTSTPTRA